MESPSGLAWDVSRKRRRPCTSSRIRRRTAAPGASCGSTRSLPIVFGFIVLGICGGRGLIRPARLQLLQELFDPVVLLDRVVEQKGQLGNAFEPETAADVAAQERRGALEGAGGVAPCFVVSDRGVERPG